MRRPWYSIRKEVFRELPLINNTDLPLCEIHRMIKREVKLTYEYLDGLNYRNKFKLDSNTIKWLVIDHNLVKEIVISYLSKRDK